MDTVYYWQIGRATDHLQLTGKLWEASLAEAMLN